MNKTSRQRKRYVLFKSDKQLADLDKSKVLQLLGLEGVDGRKRTVVWLEDGLIVKSFVGEVSHVTERLNRADLHGGKLSSMRTSGAIGKLKKLSKRGRNDPFGKVLQR